MTFWHLTLEMTDFSSFLDNSQHGHSKRNTLLEPDKHLSALTMRDRTAHTKSSAS